MALNLTRLSMSAILMLAVVSLIVQAEAADLTRPVTAQCENIDTHTFRFGTTRGGQVIDRKWSLIGAWPSWREVKSEMR